MLAIVASLGLLGGCGGEARDLAASFGQSIQDAADQNQQLNDRTAELLALSHRESVAANMAVDRAGRLKIQPACAPLPDFFGPVTIPAVLASIPDSRQRAIRQAWLARTQHVAAGCNVCLVGGVGTGPAERCLVGAASDTPATGRGASPWANPGATAVVDWETNARLDLCGIDTDEITIDDPNEQDYEDSTAVTNAFNESGIDIAVVEGALVRRNDPLLLLSEYGKALATAAAAEDVDDVETAAEQFVTKIANLAALAGPKGVAISGALKAVGGVAVGLLDLVLEGERLALIRQSVIAADPLVAQLGALACHQSLVDFDTNVRRYQRRLLELVKQANRTALDAETESSIERSRRTADLVQDVDSQLRELRTLLEHDPISAGLQIASAHAALREALENPEISIDEAKTLIEGFAGDVQASVTAIGGLAAAGP